MNGRADLRNTARNLKRDYGDVLRGQPSFRPTGTQVEVWDRLEQARLRALSPRRETRQLTFDLRA